MKNYIVRNGRQHDEMLKNYKKQQWPLKKLKKHLPIEATKPPDADQEEREQKLESLL